MGTDEAYIEGWLVLSVVAGKWSGRGAPDDIHRAVSFFLGYELWSHELAEKRVWEIAAQNIAEQDDYFKNLDFTEETADRVLAEVDSRYPEAVKYRAGVHKRTEGPLDSFSRLTGGNSKTKMYKITDKEIN